VTFDIAVLFVVLSVMAYLFFTEKLPVELTAFAGLLALIVLGYVDRDEAFVGFGSPVVITMLSIFFLSSAMLQTGIAERIGSKAEALLGNRETWIVVAVMWIAGILSAFMNNIAAAAVLLPAVGSVARRTGIPPSRLFMPLSFGAILGGTTTLVGTPPNMLAASNLADRGLEPFGLFSFTPIGLLFLLLGTVYMVVFGRRLLPDRGRSADFSETSDLVEVYHLQDTFFSIRIPADSKLDGLTLKESRFGSALGVQVVSVRREGEKRRLAPDSDTVLRGGDELLVHGRPDDLERLFRVQELEIVEAKPAELARSVARIDAIEAVVRPDSNWIGRTPRGLRFRERYGGEAPCRAALVWMRWGRGWSGPRCGHGRHATRERRALRQGNRCRH